MTDYTRVPTKLLNHAMKGEWDEALKLYKQWPWLWSEKLTVYGDTALHIAVYDGPTWVVEEMVELVSSREYDVLKSKNEEGNTPLHLAASMSNVSMCKCIARKGEDLLQRIGNKDGEENEDHLLHIRNKDGETPLFLAARHGQTEAFLCLQGEAPESARLRNKKGETILHCALAGGNFKLAFLIIEIYEDLGRTIDESGVTCLHLLANQPTAFRSGARLNLIDGIMYHSISVFPPSSGDTATSDHPAGRQTLPVKLLPVPWINNIKRLFFVIVRFFKFCIKHSNGAKAENDRMDLDEENRHAPDRAGPSEPNNEKGKKEGLRQCKYPVNYDTCFNFIMLLINIAISVIGRSYVDKIRELKEKHIFSEKILEKILDKDKGDWYNSNTGRNPLNKIRGSDLSRERPEMNLRIFSPQDHIFSEKILEKISDKGKGDWYDSSTGRNPVPPVNDWSQKWQDSFTEEGKKEREKQETPILIAARNGILEMVERILECYPVAIHDVDHQKKNIVLLAVENRQPHICGLLLRKAVLKDTAFRHVDEDGNSALHLAAKLGYSRAYPFAAVQMQWELKWFQFVRNSTPRNNYFINYNKEGKTAMEIFKESHQELASKGGEWLNIISNSCSVVVTLVAAVSFATTATAPGGIKEDSSKPTFERHPWFLIYAVSSLIALVFSVTSMVTFLAILTARPKMEDFERRLPRKLLLGLTCLFISIGAMLVCFCGAHFILIKDVLEDSAFTVYALACLPTIIFAVAQFPFYFLLLWSTFQTVPQRHFTL